MGQIVLTQARQCNVQLHYCIVCLGLQMALALTWWKSSNFSSCLVLDLQGFASVILPLLGLLSPRLGSFEGAPPTLLNTLLFCFWYAINLLHTATCFPWLNFPLQVVIDWSIIWLFDPVAQSFDYLVHHIPFHYGGSRLRCSVQMWNTLEANLLQGPLRLRRVWLSCRWPSISCALLCAVCRRYWTQTWVWVQCQCTRWIFRLMFKECPALICSSMLLSESKQLNSFSHRLERKVWGDVWVGRCQPGSLLSWCGSLQLETVYNGFCLSISHESLYSEFKAGKPSKTAWVLFTELHQALIYHRLGGPNKNM